MMRRIEAIVLAMGVSVVAAQGALVHYTLGGLTGSGVSVSGSFSFDTTVILPNAAVDDALPLLNSFSVTFTGISVDGMPATTTFSKATDTSSYFTMQLDGDGEITGFAPGFDVNSDGFSLSPGGVNLSSLEVDATFEQAAVVNWTYTQVPELSGTALGVGLGLAGFAVVRGVRRPR